MNEQATALGMDEVLALAQAGPAPVGFSPMGDCKSLLLSLEDCDAATADRLTPWLASLVCPVIGIAASATTLAQACDVVVEDMAQASMLARKIEAHPVAATTLVEVLRLTESMPLLPALRVESLAYASLQAGGEYATWLAARETQKAVEPEAWPAVLLQRDADTLQLTLNRPANRNAMSVEMRDALCEALQLALLDDSIQRLEIDAQGKCFSTGGDLAEFGSVPDVATGHIVRGLTLPGALLARLAEKTMVRVHGACIGSGLEFPAFAGRVVARRGAHFQLPEVAMGLIPGAGGCISVARRIGRQRTAWLALSGKRIREQQALEWRLVDDVID